MKSWGANNSKLERVLFESFQPPNSPVLSNFPPSNRKEEQDFSRSIDFKYLCRRLFRAEKRHGNSRMTPSKAYNIWLDYCEGGTTREAEKQYKISDTAALRVIKKITEWMNLMDTRPTNPGLGEEVATIVLRPFDPVTDTPIIYSTWRNALWYDEERDERLASEFYSLATKGIKKLLARSDVKIKIACAKHEPDFIAGYSLMTGSNLEFVYVKINYRKKGIAHLLTKECMSVSPPATKIGKIVALAHHLIIKENKHGSEETKA